MSLLSILAQTSSDFTYNYGTYNTTTTSSEDAAAAVVGLVFMLIIFTLVFLLVAIPSIIAWWKLFTKAGEPGWAAIIPIYNTYTMNKIGGGPVWYFILSLLPTVNIIGMILILVELAKKYDKPATVWLASFIPIVGVFMVGSTNYIGTQAAPAAPMGPTPPVVPPQNPTPPVQPPQTPVV